MSRANCDPRGMRPWAAASSSTCSRSPAAGRGLRDPGQVDRGRGLFIVGAAASVVEVIQPQGAG